MVSELLIGELEKGRRQQQRNGGDARGEPECQQDRTNQLDAGADGGRRRRGEPGNRMLVGVEEDCYLPVGRFENA